MPKKGSPYKIAKRERKKLVEPMLTGDYFHSVEFGPYVYVKKWNGNKKIWEIAEFSATSYAKMWAWANNFKMDKELADKLAKEE